MGDLVLPLMDPLFNLREAAKQLILLEDHLAHPSKQCEDCIRKHLLAAEAFLEEAVTLDSEGEMPSLASLPGLVRGVWTAVQDGVDLPQVGQAVRSLRKKLVEASSMLRVAAKYKNKKEVPKADGKGTTTVYEYSDRQHENAAKEKADRIEKLRGGLSKLRSKYKKDLSSKDPETSLTALAVALIDETYERVGNDESAQDGHFGVTGWEVRHLSFKGGKAVFSYVGKSGVKHTKEVSTSGVVSALKKAVKDKAKGDQILCEGDECRVTAETVNSYLKDFDVTAKDLRGLHANEEMKTRLKEVRSKGPTLPKDRKEKDKILKAEFQEALEGAAEAVGHEASTLKSQYLVPNMESAYLHDGSIPDRLNASASRVAQSFIARVNYTPGKWVETDAKTLDSEERDILWNIYTTTYASIGTNVSTLSALLAEYSLVRLIDVDGDQHIDAFIAYKKKPAGKKLALMGADGGPGSKRAMIGQTVSLLKTRGWYAEASHKLADIIEAAGVKRIDDETTVRLVMAGKDIEWLGDGHYKRFIKGVGVVKKALYGHPKVSGKRALSSSDRVAARFLATKSQTEKEDEATEDLIKISPKVKPPRTDLQKRRVKEVEPKDGDEKQDQKDRSKNYKDSALASVSEEVTVPEYRMVLQGKGAGLLAERLRKAIKESSDWCEIVPPACSGNLGIPRSQMPQIKYSDIPEFLEDMERKGIRVTDKKLRAGEMKASQKEIYAPKILQRLPKSRGKVIVPLIVSSDDFVADGHHRWATEVTRDPRGQLPVKQVDLPIRELLREMGDWDKSYSSGLTDFRTPAVPSHARVALKHFLAQVERTEEGKFRAERSDGTKDSFDTQEEAESWVKGKGESDEDPEKEKGGEGKSDKDPTDEGDKDKDAEKARDYLMKKYLDMGLSEDQVTEITDELGVGSKDDVDAATELLEEQVQESKAQEEKAREKKEKAKEKLEKDPTVDLKNPVPKSGPALEGAALKDAQKGAIDRAEAAVGKYRQMTQAERVGHSDKLATEIEKLPEGDPRRVQLEGVQRGIGIASALEDEGDAKGVGSTMAPLVKVAEKSGNLRKIMSVGAFGGSEAAGSDDQALVRSIYEDLSGPEWAEVLPDDHPGKALADLLADPEKGRFLSDADRDQVRQHLADMMTAETAFLDPLVTKEIGRDATVAEHGKAAIASRKKAMPGKMPSEPEEVKGWLSEFVQNLAGKFKSTDGDEKAEKPHEPGDVWRAGDQYGAQNLQGEGGSFETREQAETFAKKSSLQVTPLYGTSDAALPRGFERPPLDWDFSPWTL